MQHTGAQPILTTRLLLRPYVPSDAPAMYRNWASDPEVTRFTSWEAHSAPSVTEAVLADWIRQYDHPGYYHWAITKNDVPGEVIGDIAAVRTHDKRRAAEIGFCLSRACQHQGIMTEALQAVVDYLFDTVEYLTLEARHDSRDTATAALLRRARFRWQCHFRQRNGSLEVISEEELYRADSWRRRVPRLLRTLVESTCAAFGANLTGVYLHGSLAMGCFDPNLSDLDVLVVTRREPSDEDKLAYLEALCRLNELAPKKGIELSILLEDDCRAFRHPMPFVFHFSPAHLSAIQANPARYVARMKGRDPDLAAHITVLRARGRELFGQPIRQVFGEVSPQDYLDSIRDDLGDPEQTIRKMPVYVILNLCRTLAYVEENKVLSKTEGGKWALNMLPHPCPGLIRKALNSYEASFRFSAPTEDLHAFLQQTLPRIFPDFNESPTLPSE